MAPDVSVLDRSLGWVERLTWEYSCNALWARQQRSCRWDLANAQPALDIGSYSGAWTALGEQVLKEKGRDIQSQNRLIDALDQSVDLLIGLEVLARSEKISSQSNEKIIRALKELDDRIAGMVVDPLPVVKSGIVCPYCSTSVKVTLS
jgi:hypothetical protein